MSEVQGFFSLSFFYFKNCFDSNASYMNGGGVKQYRFEKLKEIKKLIN